MSWFHRIISRLKSKNDIWHVIKNNFQLYVFILLALLLPFTKTYLPYLMFLWVMSGVLAIHKISKNYHKSFILLLLPVVFYSVHIIGFIYTQDIKNGLFDLEMKLSIIFIPVVVFFITDKVKANYRVLLKLFVYGNLGASLVCLLFAINNTVVFTESGISIEHMVWPTITKGLSFFQLINQRFSYFSYGFLSIFHHPTYFSIYILFSIVILVYLIRSAQKKRTGYYFLIIYFTIFLWLLGSRAAFLTYLVSLSSFFIILIVRFKRYWIGLFLLVAGIFLSIVVFSNLQIQKNINETLEIVKDKPLNEHSDIRLWLWKSGFEIFQDNLWVGVGTGDINSALNKKYEEYNLKLANEHNLNAHNQYLDTSLKLGAVGLTILLGWIIFTFYITIKRKQFLFFYFMLIISINFLFEVILNSIAGVAFFAFFYSLLFSVYNRSQVEEE